MLDGTPKSFGTTFVSTVNRLRSHLQLGIAARLAISFIAVAVLAVVANLLVEGRVPVFRTIEVRRGRVAPVSQAAAPLLPSARTMPSAPTTAPAPVETTFPISEVLLRSIDRVDRAVDDAGGGSGTDAAARYQKLSTELDHAAADYATAATAAGESPPARFLPTVRSYRQRGADLIRLAASRHDSIADYSLHFEQLNKRVKQSVDHAWNIFGRVIARQSLMKLTDDLDDLRRRYSDLMSADSVDSSTYDALSASEGALGQTLTQDRAGFTHADGESWYTKCEEDLTAMSAARKALLQIDRERREGAAKFSDDATTLTRVVDRLGKSETFAQPRSSGQGQNVDPARTVAASAVHGGPTADQAGTGSAPPSTTASGTVTAAAGTIGASDGATAPSSAARTPTPNSSASLTDQVPPIVTTTTIEPQDGEGKTLVAWISSGVLLLVIYISAGTALSIVRPVRRLLTASAHLAKGNTAARVPRGGIRELDTLAIAFNAMAEQLSTAQEAARGQQNLLEAKVVERTLQLQELAQLDPLTRLANRRQFFSVLNTAIDHAAREKHLVGVFFLDIDNFKNMNDSLGHAFGDQVLQAIAIRLTESTRSFGFAARLGGDEFTVVYERAASVEEIRAAGIRLVRAFQQPMPLEGREIAVSVSVGASIFPGHAETAEALLRAADAALFQAKALGRSRLVVFTPDLLEAATAKFSIEQGLRRAIERGEFELAFQPEVNLQTCETELVEALVRWRMPNGQCVMPNEFLSIAEESGLIMQINDWVLRRVIETAARWHHGTWPAVRVAINVSSRQLFDNSFVEQVQALLEEHKLPPRCIEIELTENVLQTGSATIDALRRLRAHGIAIALDDFGTGFSSLTSLEQLPLTRIKLDRSLVASIDTSARSAAIARAIIALCQGLGLAITAEGIERPEQLTRLLGYSALYAQGFLLSRPVSADELMPVLASLPTLTRALVRSSLARVPESQLAEHLPFVSTVIKH